jgi:hypothetical protein
MKGLRRFNDQVDIILFNSTILFIMMIIIIIMSASFGQGEGLFSGGIGWMQLFVAMCLGVGPLARGFLAAKKVLAQYQAGILDLAKISVEQEERIRQLESQVVALSAWYPGPAHPLPGHHTPPDTFPP